MHHCHLYPLPASVAGKSTEPDNENIPGSYEALKKNYIKGWHTWNSRSVLSYVLFPSGFDINQGIKEYFYRTS